MKILFYGSSNYCLPILEVLNNNFQLVAVITKSDSLPHSFCLSHNIKVFTPKDKTELTNLISPIRQIKPDLAVVADYGLLIPPEIFNIPRYKTLNIHFSRLPKLRGPSPVQYTILTGEKSAWISVILMDEDIDTGDIIWQKDAKPNNGTMEQWSNETSGSLYKKLFDIISLELPDIINKYVNNDPPAGGKPQKQDHSQTTYTKHFTREDGYIPFQIFAAAVNRKSNISLEKELKNWPLLKKISQLPITNDQLPIIIERVVRALSPWPGVWTTVSLTRSHKDTSDGGEATTETPRWRNQNTKRLKILAVHLETVFNLPLRYTSSNTKVVGTEAKSTIKLVLDRVQLEGKKPVTWKQFIEGYPGFTFS